jgi:DNA-binding transcriptional LysR family regulator
VLYCGRGHPLFARAGEVGVADLKNQQFVRRAYTAPNKFPAGLRMESTAVGDLMESVALFILAGRYIGFLPQHYAQHWVERDLMRPLLEQELGYQNPIYLATRKTERRSPILSSFLNEFYLAQRTAIAAKGTGPRANQNGADRPKKPARSSVLA